MVRPNTSSRTGWRLLTGPALLLPLLLAGCVVGVQTTPSWTSRPAAPFSVQDVEHLLKADVSQDAILAKVREEGLEARLTTDDLCTLRAAGAREEFLERLQTVKVLQTVVIPPTPPDEYYLQPIPVVHPFPDLWPFYCGWYWSRGRWRPYPWSPVHRPPN